MQIQIQIHQSGSEANVGLARVNAWNERLAPYIRIYAAAAAAAAAAASTADT